MIRRSSRDGSVLDRALAAARRNPVAAVLTAAGAGWLIHRMSRGRARAYSAHRIESAAEDIPILNTGHARIYDPDASPRHPMQDSLESRREMSACV